MASGTAFLERKCQGNFKNGFKNISIDTHQITRVITGSKIKLI
jgi:hypothetical protein